MSVGDNSSGVLYVPSTTEKKKVIACFFFMGIVMYLTARSPVSVYEYHYLSISISWWILFVCIVPLFFIAFFIPVFLLLFSPFILLWLGFGVLFVWRARLGVYDLSNSFTRFFVGMGSWMLNLFDISLYQESK